MLPTKASSIGVCVYAAALTSALSHQHLQKPAELRSFRTFHHHYEGEWALRVIDI